MFSEHVGRSKERGSAKKKVGKPMKFDDLDEKKLGKELGKMKVDEKREAKYSPQSQRSDHVKDSHLFKAVAQKEIAKSQELKKDPVGYSLYETANAMCSIVDITKDSTIQRQSDKTPPIGGNKKEPKKTLSRTSLMSQSSTTGPFAQLKENEQKKKKSFDEVEN